MSSTAHDDPRPRIAISGSYGGRNLGDEAILHAIVAELRADLPEAEIVVFTHDAEDTLERHPVDRAVAVHDLTREEARQEVSLLDLLVLGGGGILYDRDAELYLREVALAHDASVPVAVYAISAGPLETRAARELVREHVGRATLITVRDRQGKQLLEDVGIDRPIHVTADPALLLEPEELPDDALLREGVHGKRRLVALSVREPGPAAPELDVGHYHALLAHAADFMIDRFDAEIVFVPMERRKMDIQHSHAVLAGMELARHATVLKGKYSPAQLLSLFRHFDFALGMRLHFLIFAALQGVPLVALPYASKVTGLVEELAMEMPPLERVTTGRLIAHIDRSWDRQGELRARLEARIPELRERARETQRLLLPLLRPRAELHPR
jgi:polysaccharide pyruvyl transferase CsaB